MALTQQVKSELATVVTTKPCCRRAEAAAMLRFSGGLHLAGGQIIVEAELDTGAAARRLRSTITEVFGLQSELVTVTSSGLRRGTRYICLLYTSPSPRD